MEPQRLAGSRPGGAFGELGADTTFNEPAIPLLDQPSAHQHDSTVKADQRESKQHADMQHYLG